MQHVKENSIWGSFAAVIFLPGVEGSMGQQFGEQEDAVSAVINTFFGIWNIHKGQDWIIDKGNM